MHCSSKVLKGRNLDAHSMAWLMWHSSRSWAKRWPANLLPRMRAGLVLFRVETLLSSTERAKARLWRLHNIQSLHRKT